jgi:hypothetical protein
MDDLDARRRLEPEVLRVLDAIFNLTNGAEDARLSAGRVAEYLGQSEAEIKTGLRVLVDDVRRIHSDEIDTGGAPSTFTTIYTPLGDAYPTYIALREQRGADASGAVPRQALEQMQGYWQDIGHVDFDAGLADLEAHGWAECKGDCWALTPRGVTLGESRLQLP